MGDGKHTNMRKWSTQFSQLLCSVRALQEACKAPACRPALPCGIRTWQALRRVVCTLMAGNRFWKVTAASFICSSPPAHAVCAVWCGSGVVGRLRGMPWLLLRLNLGNAAVKRKRTVSCCAACHAQPAALCCSAVPQAWHLPPQTHQSCSSPRGAGPATWPAGCAAAAARPPHRG